MMGQRRDERLRQERETFDQHKAHHSAWFGLRLTTGFVAIIALVVILCVAAIVVMSPGRYSGTVVTLAAVAILADIAALAGMALLLVLRDGSGRLRPVARRPGK
jgi:purine-cytosine permease-like protein